MDDAPHVRSTEPKPEDSMTWLRDEEAEMQREWLPTPAAQEPGSPRYGRLVTALLSPEAFYDSARGFAATALQAHHTRDYGA